MFSTQQIEDFKVRVSEAGLSLTEESPEGPNGELRWTFSDDVADLQVGDDRGELFVAVGPRGATCFVGATWVGLLGIDPPRSEEFDSQLEYSLANLDKMRKAIESDGDILENLRDANWSIVKKSLNIDPNMPRPGRRPRRV
jgi:hypothetical protein